MHGGWVWPVCGRPKIMSVLEDGSNGVCCKLGSQTFFNFAGGLFCDGASVWDPRSHELDDYNC